LIAKPPELIDYRHHRSDPLYMQLSTDRARSEELKTLGKKKERKGERSPNASHDARERGGGSEFNAILKRRISF
jgi:hypothetical protein